MLRNNRHKAPKTRTQTKLQQAHPRTASLGSRDSRQAQMGIVSKPHPHKTERAERSKVTILNNNSRTIQTRQGRRQAKASASGIRPAQPSAVEANGNSRVGTRINPRPRAVARMAG
jgi:hypothetical protein